MSDQPVKKHIRTGVARNQAGWWVMQEIDGRRVLYGFNGEPFLDEARADMAAQEMAKVTREMFAVLGCAITEPGK